jgi:hypothetical protein
MQDLHDHQKACIISRNEPGTVGEKPKSEKLSFVAFLKYETMSHY